MRYLADLLTFVRLCLAFVVMAMILNAHWLLAVLLFCLAALTDAADGFCARRWPYTPEDERRLPWRRIDHHLLDNIPDGLMVALAVFALALQFSYWWWLMALIYGVSALFFIAVQLLARRGMVRSAEIVDVIYGWWFAANIAMVIGELALRSTYFGVVGTVAVLVVPVIVLAKRDRAFTRPETRALAESHRS